MQRDGGRQYLTDQLKTIESRRSVTLPAAMIDSLRRHRARQAERRLARKGVWAAGDLVFTTPEGTMLRSDKLGYATRLACKGAGLDERAITPNGFRHTNASLLIAAGYSYTNIAEHLGHKNTQMLILVYGHPTGRLLDPTTMVARMTGGAS
jgi:integrase